MIAVREDSRSGGIADVGTEQACWRRCTDVHRCCTRDDDASPNTLSACMGVYFRRGSSAEADLRKKTRKACKWQGPANSPGRSTTSALPAGLVHAQVHTVGVLLRVIQALLGLRFASCDKRKHRGARAATQTDIEFGEHIDRARGKTVHKGGRNVRNIHIASRRPECVFSARSCNCVAPCCSRARSLCPT